MKEEVIVEHVPVPEGAEPSAEAFRETSTTIPLHEEVVEVTKRPVVREEVRVSKTATQGEERISEKTRKETARIETEAAKRMPREEDRPQRHQTRFRLR